MYAFWRNTFKIFCATKQLCKFNKTLQNDFRYLRKVKNDVFVYCTICSGPFSISHSGRSDINDGQKTDKQVANCYSISYFFFMNIIH